MDLTPNYLDGKNIQRHAEVIDTQNNQLQNKINQIGLHHKLIRPIMFEKEITENNQIFQTYINTIHSIKEVNITDGTGQIITNYTYTEDEAITQASYDLTEYITTENNLTNETGLINPSVCVEVVTFDEWETYLKAYPENDYPMQWQDETLDAARNHDIYLDRIGALLNIPRRKYTTYNISEQYNATPSGFGKQVTDDQVQECTEDDYQYYKRLQYFIEHYPTDTFTALMLYIIYGYRTINVFNSYTRREDPVIAHYIDANEDPFHPATMLISVEDNPANIAGLTTNEDKKRFLDLYNPLTRPTTILNMIDTVVNVEFRDDDITNANKLHPEFQATVGDTNDYLFREAPLNYYFNNPETTATVMTDDDENTPTAYITANEILPRGANTLCVEFDKHAELSHATNNFYFNYLLDENITVNTNDWTIIPHGNQYEMVIYNSNLFKRDDAEYNIRIIVAPTRNYRVGIAQQLETYTDTETTPYLLNTTGIPVYNYHVIRVYNNGKITIDGVNQSFYTYNNYIPTDSYLFFLSQSTNGFDLSSIESMKYSQMDSLSLTSTSEGSLYDHYLYGGCPVDVSQGDHTFRFEVEFCGRLHASLIEPENANHNHTQDFTNSTQKKRMIDFKIHNGQLKVYDDGIFKSELSVNFNVMIPRLGKHKESTYFRIIDVSYAPTCDLNE